MKIAIDLDGVVFDFNNHFQSFASKIMNVRLEQLSDAYNLSDRFGLSNDLAGTIWKRFFKDRAYAEVPVYKDVHKWIDQLIEDGHDAIFITAVSPELEPLRRENLKMINQEDAVISFTGSHDFGHTKHDALEDHKPDMLIDDQLLNLLHAKEMGVEQLIWVDNGDSQLQDPNSDIDIRTQWRDIATERVTSLAEIELTSLRPLYV